MEPLAVGWDNGTYCRGLTMGPIAVAHPNTSCQLSIAPPRILSMSLPSLYIASSIWHKL